MTPPKKGSSLFFALLLPILLFLSFNKHSKDEPGTYHSVFWADEAGYYIYLPMTFIYGWNSEELPKGIEERTGEGFRKGEEKLFTKYWLGTALLQLPFFIGAHALAPLMEYPQNGFSGIYQGAIMVAGVFYAWAGCLLLFRSIRKWGLKEFEASLTVLVLIAGTHLYYYSIEQPGMSHVYSFFLFSATMLGSWKWWEKPTGSRSACLGLLVGAIVLTRPSNIIFFAFPLLFSFGGVNGAPLLRSLLGERKKAIPILLGFSLLLFLPQLFYWYWLSGDPIIYSYGDEGFSNWDSPMIHKVLFSTKNGLIPYTPMYILILGGIAKLIYEKDRNGWAFLFLFLLLTYIVSSWWTWYFGCSFGARNYVEYLAPFSIPLGHLLFRTHSKGMKFLFAGFALLFIYANLELVYYYDGCFYGGVWDWEAYWNFYG